MAIFLKEVRRVSAKKEVKPQESTENILVVAADRDIRVSLVMMLEGYCDCEVAGVEPADCEIGLDDNGPKPALVLVDRFPGGLEIARELIGAGHEVFLCRFRLASPLPGIAGYYYNQNNGEGVDWAAFFLEIDKPCQVI